MRFAVVATGPSLTPDQVERVRGLRVIVVNDAFRLAPWAEALVAQDKAWWRRYPEALDFPGRKFSCNPDCGVEVLQGTAYLQVGTNSGLAGIELARVIGATEILLLGFDQRGSHYFGPHPEGLKRTEERTGKHEGFARMQAQFHNWARGNKRVRVINCTPGSALTAFPMGSLDACLA